MENENFTKLLYVYNAFAFINYVIKSVRTYHQNKHGRLAD